MSTDDKPTVWIRGTEPNYPKIAGAATFHVEQLVRALDKVMSQEGTAYDFMAARMAREAARDWLAERKREQAAHDANLLGPVTPEERAWQRDGQGGR